MSNIHEALQRARKEGGGADPIPLLKRDRVSDLLPDLPAVARGHRLQRHPDEMAALFASVRPFLDNYKGAVVQVVAATEGEGTSTIAREFAFVAATTGNRRTLLIDGDVGNAQTARFFECPANPGIIECVLRGMNEKSVLRPVSDSKLCVARLASEEGAHCVELETRSLYGTLRERYDLTVIDCPSVNSSRYTALAPGAADGIIFVIQAEKARPALVAHARDTIEQAGGRIIGAVLNRRRNYVPRFLYKRL
jgi:Mrp family chromosome partitioning ATPase